MATHSRPLERLLDAVAGGARAGGDELLARLPSTTAAQLQPLAEQLVLDGHGRVITWSPKVFLPLSRLCRDVCHYCTFAEAPRHLRAPYMTVDEVVAIALEGQHLGCHEALFTLGDKPELRYPAARRALAAMGLERTIEHLERAATAVLDRTSLLPHLNPGVLDTEDLARLRPIAVSMGLMLESTAARLCARGGPHFGSPDKQPARRLQMIDDAGRLGIAFTSGILIGIGETRAERLEALLALRDLHERHGHLQDLIIQNFQPKPGTRMASHPAPALEEQLWTIAAARIVFGPEMSIQTPPNLRPDALHALAASGINDWGGVSPLTPDHVNPEAPWPERDALAAAADRCGRALVERLAITPRHAADPDRWLAPELATRVRRLTDAEGLAHTGRWHAGADVPVPKMLPGASWPQQRRDGIRPARHVARALSAVLAGGPPDAADVTMLFRAHGTDLDTVLAAADEQRHAVAGDRASYVINRNINYTNICTYRCGFCAFSKGRSARSRRGPGYLLELDEIARRAEEAWRNGATEVCLQGGIHPSFTGRTYLDIVAAIRSALPDIHIHAFSPLEIRHGADTLGQSLDTYLRRLRRAGLGSLPGTAAEILDDGVRATLCPDKLDTARWLEVMEAAHRVGLRSTSTMMFGHVDAPRHWAAHLLHLRTLQARTGGFTEFVPLPFVHAEAPLWRRGLARSGPAFREVLLVHAVARLVFGGTLAHVQASWVKLGADGLEACLRAGADDMGGVLMNESITRAAGGDHGQSMSAAALVDVARQLGRTPWQRTTLYDEAPARAAAAHSAVPVPLASGG